MATRHLRRIQEQANKQGDCGVSLGGEGEEEHEDEVIVETKKVPFNPFDLLSDEEGPGEMSDSEDRSGGAAGEAAAGRDDAQEQQEQHRQQEQPRLKTSIKQKAAAAAKKKKKAGKAGKQTDATGEGMPEHNKQGKAAGAATVVKGIEEDIEAIVRELNLTTVGSNAAGGSTSGAIVAGSPAGAAAAGSGAATSAASVLCVDVKGLRGDEELRRIFGSDVVAAVDREDRMAAAEARRAGAVARGLPGRRRGLALKRGWLVAPKEHWPQCEGGLSMVMTGSKTGAPVFRYVFSPAYKETQARFLRCQASYDPATIAALLQQAPYHVDSLLAMHDLYRHMGENNYAEEMLDRALWMLESAWHPAFQPAIAVCRLDYAAEENRALFGALFRHVQALSRRGCHRASLECCKLLLALEPEDPLGGLCLVDYLAVRAGRYDWLRRFVLHFEGNRSLALLPNYAFALPMAAHRQEQEQQRQQPGSASGTAAERAQPGASSSGTPSSSSSSSPHELLVGALLLHPLVLPRLIARLQDKGAAKEPYWKELLSRRLFTSATDGGSASLSHLVGLYVERSGELWKPPDLLALLRRAAAEAADVAEGKVAPSNGIGAADWKAVAKESFPVSTANEYRHLRLADFSDAVNALPREEVEAAVQGGGAMQDVEEALAELQEQMILAAQDRQQEQANAGRAAAPMTDEQLRGANPLVMLLRSLLPWVNAGQQPDYTADGDGAAAAAAAAAAAGPAAAAPRPAAAARPLPPPPPPPPPPLQLEYDEDDGHLDDEEGVVRQVRR
ncbi:hypothetical protein Vafri_14657 [Volvox africanus]|uniref:Transcription factor 25 n=1 Tax=Volvox africanus TaxID=51714 RepID=A0A8J4BES5_9CHLO|nr:hypothetical protein Vafri_14657 [Volvox africanus]